mgnify:FL=1
MVENLEVPPFSTLNADIIPSEDFLNTVEKFQPKFDLDLVKQVWHSAGVQTCDDRVLKVASAMLEIQMLKIIEELKCVAS